MAKWNEKAKARTRRSRYRPGGTVDPENIGDDFDEVLDPLNDLMTGRNKSLPASRNGTPDGHDPIQTARERQQLERDLRSFERNMRDVLSERLMSQGIRIDGVMHDRNCDFTVYATSGRVRCDVNLSMDEALGVTDFRDRDAFMALCDKVATKILTTRETFRIMGRLG